MSDDIVVKGKYLKSYSGGVEVFIRRLGITYTKKFSYRSHNGFRNTMVVAKRHRDKVYLELFGHALEDGFHHLKKRKTKRKSICGPIIPLPPGVSLGYSRGKLLYIVSSNIGKNKKISRKRWNIKKLGLTTSLLMAESYRNKNI